MKAAFRHKFTSAKLRRTAVLKNGVLELYADGFFHVPYTTTPCDNYIFRICLPGSHREIGEIALRIGEGDALYYLGHIGYHIDPPARGHGYALEACRLVLPVFREYGMRSLCITTDPDNWASIKTCQRLGCVLESTVPVPSWCRKAYELSSVKNRYLYIFT